MSIYTELSKLANDISTEVALSLPMRTRSCELVFTYSTIPNSRTSYKVEKIWNVIVYDVQSHQIKIEEPRLQIGDIVYGQGSNAIVEPSITGSVALEVENKYRDAYEKFLQFAYDTSLSIEKVSIIHELVDSFHLLVPKSALRDAYYSIGKDYFEYLEKSC